MSRLRILFLLTAVLLFGVCPMFATEYAVGTCKPSLPSYPSITAALAAVPAGATVLVCPGTYAEQFTISTQLNLEGISSANGDRAVITVPGGGLTVNATSLALGMTISIAAQVLVTATTGPVNITNITVDGTGNGLSGTGDLLVGIFYASGSSGTVDQVTARNEITGSSSGNGIWAENDTATPESVTIENSSVSDADDDGIVIVSTQSTPTLTATVRGNDVTNTLNGIISAGAAGSITGNVVTDTVNFGGTSGFGGIVVVSNGSVAASVTGNTVTDSSQYGIFALQDAGGVIIKSNSVFNSTVGGIGFNATGATVQSNKITKAGVGIEIDCMAATVSGNTISNASKGINDAPLSFSMANTFDNVDTIRSGGTCTSALGREALRLGEAVLISRFRSQPN